MMIRKRYLIVVTVAIVSVLLGSLLYSNLALAGKPEPQPSIYKDTAEITALDWIARYYNGEEYGIKIHVDSAWWYPMQKFPFIFDPKPELVNVTDLWISITGTSYAAYNDYEFRLYVVLNDVEVWQGMTRFDIPVAGITTVHIENPNLNQGVNVIQLSVDDNVLTVHRITVFVEYEYQA